MTTTEQTLPTIQLRVKLHAYWQLIKSLQTGLLLLTGMAGYLSARCPVWAWPGLLGLTVTLFLAISGSTAIAGAWGDPDAGDSSGWAYVRSPGIEHVGRAGDMPGGVARGGRWWYCAVPDREPGAAPANDSIP